MQLSANEAIVMISGVHPVRAGKVRYYEDAQMKSRVLEPFRGSPPSLAAQADDWSGRTQIPPSVELLAKMKRGTRDPNGGMARPKLNRTLPVEALCRERIGLHAFAMQGLYATRVAAAALGIACGVLSELITLASHKTPRGLRLADNAVMQADLARAKARLGERLPHRHAHNAEADDVAPIDITNRGRVRLACANAIPGAVELGDFARERASMRSSRAVRSSSASATCTRLISRSGHAPTILLWEQSHTRSQS